MKQFKKLTSWILTLVMVMTTVFIGKIGISYVDAADADATITLPLTIRDTYMDGFVFEFNKLRENGTNDSGENVPKAFGETDNDEEPKKTGRVKGLVESNLDVDKKPVYNDKIGEKSIGISGLAENIYVILTNNLYSNNYYSNSTGRNKLLYNALKQQLGNSIEKGNYQGTISKNPTTFDKIKTCYDAAYWMTYNLYRDNATFKYNNRAYDYTTKISAYDKLVLNKQSDGSYSFNATTNNEKVDYNTTAKSIQNSDTGSQRGGFFPVDGIGLNENLNNHNFAYTLESSGKFVYHQNENLYFDFNGDDDVYLFINGKLALDIGGQHGQINDVVRLESEYGNGQTWAQYLGLEEGKIYDFNFFYMERHTSAANMSIKTNIRVYDAAAVPQKNAYVQDDKLPYGGLVASGTEVNYEFVLSNIGDVTVTNLTFVDNTIGVSLSETAINLNERTTIEDLKVKIDNKSGYETYKSVTEAELKGLLEAGILPGETIRIKGFNYILGNTEVLNTLTYTAKAGDKTLTNTAQNKIVPVKGADKAYVIDYGKPVTYTYEETFAEAFESAQGSIKHDINLQDPIGSYGNMSNDTSEKTITYTLNKFMLGIDVFRFNHAITSKDENNVEYTTNLQTVVSMIPATSVYYEDDFGTDANTDSNVAIVWTGSWSKEGNSQDEKQSSANENYGWEETYTDDAGYSNGSAHKVSEKGATATFTFTGTGVDVYSRTNGDVGMIRASIYVEDSNVAMSTKYIDNISVSGDYYQIPTLTFDGLDYDTYTVVLTAGAVGKSGKTTYYLDGIRVYNPLKGNATAEDAYEQADEANAVYKQVRASLIANGFDTTNTEAVKGVVFIDKVEDSTGVEINQPSVYEDYGPKNEVYLKAGQSIAFKIDGYTSANKVAVGIKAPNGNATVSYSNGANRAEKEIASAADLYYTVVPDANGNVVIENKSGNLLAITKVKITTKKGEAAQAANYSFMATPALMSYVNEFDSLPVADVDAPVVGEEQPSTPSEDENLGEGDVDIENPSEEEPAQSESILDRLIKSLKKWFRF